MAVGDQNDILGRTKALLPYRWFPDSTPVLDALLSGAAWALSFIYSLIQYAKAQTRIATATDGFLDLIAYDFFGTNLLRRSGETDSQYRARIMAAILQPKGTRQAMIAALQNLTGETPKIFEPARPDDTGGWGIGCGWSAAGGWGSLQLEAQAFIIAYRQPDSGIPNVAGWSASYGAWGGGYSCWASLTQVTGAVTDDDIYATIAATKAEGTEMWVQLQDAA